MRFCQTTSSLSVKPEWEQMIRDVFNINPAQRNFDNGHFVLSLEKSSCMTEESSRSRYNIAHVEAVLTLVLANYKYDGYKGSEMKIITPYAAQRNLYRRALFHMRSEVPEASQPAVETIDSMQGREAKLIILDFTISDAVKARDLGFVDDDHRCNVAHSRMMEVLVTVMPTRIGTGRLGTNPMERMNAFGEIVRPRVPYPVAYMQWAASNRMVMDVKEVPGSVKLDFLEMDNTTDTWGTGADGGTWEGKDESTERLYKSGNW